MQRLFAIALLTWKAAFRFRLFLVLAILLLGSVVGLPLLIKDDGTARGFTQIVLTYTLGTVSALLGLSTLWLACGTLARDIEECQMQVVAVKPIARWQIWLGKWLGIMSLNAALLILCGGSIYGLLRWRASRLPAEEQAVLRNEVLVARGSVRPVYPEKELERAAEQFLQERRKTAHISEGDLPEALRLTREQLKTALQVVAPDSPHWWTINLGKARLALRDRPLFLRIKFNSSDMRTSGTFDGQWLVGNPGKTPLWRSEVMSLAPETFHEFPIPANLFDDAGTLTVSFYNRNNVSLLFSVEEGIEVLYREASFEVNFLRGLGIIFCWMGLLAALGLAAASFLSFPVAAFLALGILTLVFSTGTMTNALEVGTIADYNAEKGTRSSSVADAVVLPTFRALLKVISLAKDFSPIDALSTGRSITWTQLGVAFAQIVLLLGGIFAVFGIAVFTRRELATAQGP
jgi:hypothetical protein